MVKAVNGGGGRGMRVVTEASDIEAAFTRCQAESLSAFGSDKLYVERFLPAVRHIEVQIVGDGKMSFICGSGIAPFSGAIKKLLNWHRRPTWMLVSGNSFWMPPLLLVKACDYKGLGTVEFLVEVKPDHRAGEFFFIETNPRIQVEHTITEEVTGLDLVAIQLRIAAGESLADLGLDQKSIPLPKATLCRRASIPKPSMIRVNWCPPAAPFSSFNCPVAPVFVSIPMPMRAIAPTPILIPCWPS